MNRILPYLESEQSTVFRANARDVLRSRAAISFRDVHHFKAEQRDSGLWVIELMLLGSDLHVWGHDDPGICLSMFRSAMPQIRKYGEWMRS